LNFQSAFLLVGQAIGQETIDKVFSFANIKIRQTTNPMVEEESLKNE